VNRSDVVLLLRSLNSVSFHNLADVITVEPHSTRKVQVNTPAIGETVSLEFEVLNAIVSPDEHLSLSYTVKLEAEIDEGQPVEGAVQ
jgi:hypothetical protein